MSIEIKTLLDQQIKGLQNVPGINQDTKDMLTGLTDNLVKIPNRPNIVDAIFAARQAMRMNPETEK